MTGDCCCRTIQQQLYAGYFPMIARARHRRLCVLGQNKSMATACRCRRAHSDNSSTLSHDPNQATSYSSSRRVLPETSRLHPVRLAPGYLHSLVWSRLTFCLAASGFTCPLLLSRVSWPKVSTGVLEDAQYTCEPQRCVYQVLCENLAVGGFFGNFLPGVGGRFQVSLRIPQRASSATREETPREQITLA